jgi:hypothetical protein
VSPRLGESMRKVFEVKPSDNEIPIGYDLCISEGYDSDSQLNDMSSAIILNGFDEMAMGLFEEDFENPVYVFVKN